MNPPRPIYLDHHATTPVDPDVVREMLPYLQGEFGNPGSRTHAYGQRAATAIDQARSSIAELVGASERDVVLTSGATESNNLAIQGICVGPPGHVVTASTEHHAVLDVCELVRSRGWEVTMLGVQADGRIDISDLAAALRPATSLVSIMWANNETGSINSIPKIAHLCRDAGVFLHCDAAQAPGRVPIDLATTPVDLLSLSAHKMYGPKGVGALVANRRARRALQPILRGGGQERGLRAGTLAPHQVVGMGRAAALARAGLENGEPERLRVLRDRFHHALATLAGDIVLNGSAQHRLPTSLNIWIRGCDTEALALRSSEVAFSTGSACSSSSFEPSHVILAMSGDPERASESARFGFGRYTTPAEVDRASASLAGHIKELRALRRSGPAAEASSLSESVRSSS